MRGGEGGRRCLLRVLVEPRRLALEHQPHLAHDLLQPGRLLGRHVDGDEGAHVALPLLLRLEQLRLPRLDVPRLQAAGGGGEWEAVGSAVACGKCVVTPSAEGRFAKGRSIRVACELRKARTCFSRARSASCRTSRAASCTRNTSAPFDAALGCAGSCAFDSSPSTAFGAPARPPASAARVAARAACAAVSATAACSASLACADASAAVRAAWAAATLAAVAAAASASASAASLAIASRRSVDDASSARR